MENADLKINLKGAQSAPEGSNMPSAEDILDMKEQLMHNKIEIETLTKKLEDSNKTILGLQDMNQRLFLRAAQPVEQKEHSDNPPEDPILTAAKAKVEAMNKEFLETQKAIDQHVTK